MLALSSAAPGDHSTACISISFGGPSRTAVRLYGRVSGRLSRHLRLTVTRGSDRAPSFPSCASFSADRTNYAGAGPGVIYSGRLSEYPQSAATGLLDPAGADRGWEAGERHSYRFSVSLVDGDRAQGLSARSTFLWQARTP